jgi:fibronectin-binding autotransporter adhesin
MKASNRKHAPAVGRDEVRHHRPSPPVDFAPPGPGFAAALATRLAPPAGSRTLAALSAMLVLLAFASASISRAQTTLYWDANGAAAGTGGTGNWSPAAGNLWRVNSATGALTAWSNTNPDDYAIFGGTAGTVTVNANTDVARMTFLVSGYTIARSAGTFTLTTDGIIDTGGSSATISAPMAGTVGLTKNGAGTLTLSGVNTYTGATTISAGTLLLGANNIFANTSTLSVAGGALNINTRTDTVGAVTLSSGSITGTTGILTGASYAVTNATGNTTISAILAGAVALTKTGAGTLTLSGGTTTTTYTGGTNINAGILMLGASNALANTGAVWVGGGTFDIGAFSDTVGAVTLSSGSIIGTTGVLAGTSYSVTNATGNTSISAILGGGVTMTKSGAGTVTLSGNNTYTGLTTVSAGTLQLGASGGATNTPLGTTGAGTTVTSGATLDLNGFTLGTAEALTLSGTGLSSAGALVNTAGAATFSGAVTLGAVAPSIGGAGNIHLAGAVGDGASTALTKVGANTLTLSGNNTFTGGTTIGAGVLDAAHNNALGASGNIVVADGGQLGLNAPGTETFPPYVPGNPSPISTFAVGGGTNTVTLTGAGPGGSSAALINHYTGGGGSFAQLNNNIVLAGNTTLSSGSTAGNTLALGRRGFYNVPAGTTVDTNSTIAVGTHTLTLIGAAGTVTRFEGGLTGSGNVHITTDGAVHLYGPEHTFSGTTTVANGTLRVDSSPNNAAPNDTGYNKFYGINGPLVIGDGSGAPNSAIVYLGDGTALGTVPEGINHTVPITLFPDGLLSLKNNGQTIGKLTMTGGTVDSGSGGITYLDMANTSVSIAPTATSGPATLNGQLYLTYHLWAPSESTIRQTRTFDVGYDATNVATGDLVVNANVNVGALVKTGAGTMTLQTAHNDYEGKTTVSHGILNVRVGTDGASKSSLGLGGSVNDDTTVGASGTLQLQNNIAITTELLSLAGHGHNGTQGALENLSGNNTWGAALTGQIALAGNASIGSTAGLLTIPTTLSSSGGPAGLTVRGAGDTTITGNINTGASGAATLTKLGNGTLTLSGTSGYQGLTDIQGGVVVVTSALALGDLVAGTVVSSGAELRLTNNITIAGEALTLNGPGFGTNTGALRNVSGSNTYGGAITVGSPNARINSDTGLLALTGGISTGGNAFVVGGAGNTTETGTVGGSGALTKDGAGTATFSNLTGLGNVTLDAGTLTFSGASMTGSTVNLNAGTLNFNGATATVGQVHLLGGASSTINVGSSTTLTTYEFDSNALSTLSIASGGMVVANYGTGTTTTFSGQLAGTGTFQALGAGTVIFDQTSVSASGLTVYLGGTSVGTNASPLTFSITNNAHLTFNTLYITGDTILDFGNSSASFLTSANLYISANVLITVQNWISMVDAWFVTGSSPGFSGSLLDRTGSTPENQITFAGFSNNSTAWINQSTYGNFNQNEIRPVPEPATYGALFISGGFGLSAFRHYRRHRLAGRAA